MKPFVSVTQVTNEVRIQAQGFLIVKNLFSFNFHSSLPLCVPWTDSELSVLVVLQVGCLGGVEEGREQGHLVGLAADYKPSRRICFQSICLHLSRFCKKLML